MTRRYRVSPRMLELGVRYVQAGELVECAMPLLFELSRRTEHRQRKGLKNRAEDSHQPARRPAERGAADRAVWTGLAMGGQTWSTPAAAPVP
jgi:hypothetical protein